ncbi:trihelix transcription factor ASIL1-like [Vigna radiata var. radiata]|uniref:Trihelix transcription factor ASIL1-like n=1 Tax=Vigna radiata var. radiata TaxID=3916 RepID=A0A1S3U0G0_VIGRR|nr:trihelix transcription factor ASIL1-like [Vigna radiata var. radiata]XP_022637133.1 trihelix transcription factor ASIL1-like [Vigna radiata var. radiata]
MDGIEDDASYHPNPYRIISHQRGYGYQNSPYSLPVNTEYAHHHDEDEEQEQLEGDDEVDQSNSLQLPQKDGDEENGIDGVGDENDDEEEEVEDNKQIGYYATKNEDDLEWPPKKQKLKSLISTYELAPLVPASSAAAPVPTAPKPSSGGRNSLTDWTEHETFVLLDAWGDTFLQLGRKSLRCEEWQQVSKMVAQVSKIERTDTQCRNRLDTLKKKYKKEKAKFQESDGGDCKWVYFKRMDELMSSPPQQVGISCGFDSGDYVFMNPGVYLNQANGLDELRDSPDNVESTGEEGSDGLQLQAKKRKGRSSDEASSFSLLADSIQKFSRIYEKIENNKRQQMMELEKMRMDFHKELETQKRQILGNLQSEISKLEQRNDENEDSAENGM